MTSVLLDANLLVYCYDARDAAKQQRACDLIGALTYSRTGAVSTQVLAEFYSAVIRKLPHVPPNDALARIVDLANAFTVCDITLPIVLEAARGAGEHRMSYWDAQVWATAKLNQIPYVLTENMQGRDLLEGVRFLNPLAEGFDMSVLAARR